MKKLIIILTLTIFVTMSLVTAKPAHAIDDGAAAVIGFASLLGGMFIGQQQGGHNRGHDYHNHNYRNHRHHGRRHHGYNRRPKVIIEKHYYNGKPRHHKKHHNPQASRKMLFKKVWVPPVIEKIWNPAHYSKHGDWMPGQWIQIERRSGHYKMVPVDDHDMHR